jgi:hypothetical protein
MSMETVLEKVLKESYTSSPVSGSDQDIDEERQVKADFFASIRKAQTASTQKTSPRQRAKTLVGTWLTSETGSSGSLDDATFLGIVKEKQLN